MVGICWDDSGCNDRFGYTDSQNGWCGINCEQIELESSEHEQDGWCMAPRTSREGWNAELGRAADLGVEHIGIDAGGCEGGIGYENSDMY